MVWLDYHVLLYSSLSTCPKENRRIPSNVAKRHFKAASRLICIPALPSISGPGSYSGDFNTPMRSVWSGSHHVGSDVGCYETRRHTQWEVGTNCFIRLSVPLKPPEQRWVTTSWGQIICCRSSLLVFLARLPRENEALRPCQTDQVWGVTHRENSSLNVPRMFLNQQGATRLGKEAISPRQLDSQSID